MQRFRWQQAEGRRHAYDAESVGTAHPGIAFTTLCGVEVTPARRDFVELDGRWHDPTCWHCDHEWRVRDDFPPCDIPRLPENT